MLKLTSFNPVKKEGRLFDTFFDDFFDFPTPARISSFKLDVKEEDNCIVIEADLPGINKDEVKINYENDHLLIGVEKKEEKEEEKKNYLHRERMYSSMQRAVYLPDLDPQKVKAKLTDGVLKVTAEKKTIENKTNFIEIE
jgi:HSP20 family protein